MIHLSDISQEGFIKAGHLILNYLMSNETALYCEMASDTSKKVGVSLATVGRFWPKIGFDSFKESKRAQLSQNSATPASKAKNTLFSLIGSNRTSPDWMVKNIDILVNTLERTMKLISSETIETAVRLIAQKQEVYVFAPDASFGITHVVKYRLRRFGIELILMDGESALYESLNSTRKEDLVLIFCSGRVLAETTALPTQKNYVGFSCVIFSGLLANGLQNSKVFLYCYRRESTEYHPTVSLMAIVDSLIIKITMESFDSMARINQLNDPRNEYQKHIRRQLKSVR